MFVISHQLNYTEMFVGTHINKQYVVVSIVSITVLIYIELFYLTQLSSFLECLCEDLSIFIIIFLRYLLYNV